MKFEKQHGERNGKIFLLKRYRQPGYVDIPEEATTIREAIYGIGGGIPNGKKFKAVQIGGPSGGLLVEEHLDLPLHFQKLKPYGVRRGDSVITVLDETAAWSMSRVALCSTRRQSSAASAFPAARHA